MVAVAGAGVLESAEGWMLEMGATLQGREGRKRRDSLLSPNQQEKPDYLSIHFPNLALKLQIIDVDVQFSCSTSVNINLALILAVPEARLSLRPPARLVRLVALTTWPNLLLQSSRCFLIDHVSHKSTPI